MTTYIHTHVRIVYTDKEIEAAYKTREFFEKIGFESVGEQIPDNESAYGSIDLLKTKSEQTDAPLYPLTV